MSMVITNAEELAKEIIWREYDQVLRLKSMDQTLKVSDKYKINFNDEDIYVKEIAINKTDEVLDIITDEDEVVSLPLYTYDKNMECYTPTEIYLEINP